MTIKYKKIHPLAKEPYQKYSTDACFDVYATSKEILEGGKIIKYGIGLAFELPEGTRLDLRPRSSIFKHGLILSNSTATGDYGYTGEYFFHFYNIIDSLPNYEIGDRIGQIHVEHVNSISFIEVDNLSEAERGNNGFGSTGKS